MTQEHFIPQLQRLLGPGGSGDRRIYDSLVDDVVKSSNPLDLFQISQQRSGVYLIEALYRTHVEQALSGDLEVVSSLADLGYSRWLAWRRFRDAVRSGMVGYGRGVDRYVNRSRDDVVEHVRRGWRPEDGHGDDELDILLGKN